MLAMKSRHIRWSGCAFALIASLSGVVASYGAEPPTPATTTVIDFFRGGSQPTSTYEQFVTSRNCGLCHRSDDASILINKPWEGSMHGLSARDPLWRASFTIAEQDAPFVGDMCIRCHVPRAWIMGRSKPTDGSKINRGDRDGVTCHYCHRMVDPFYKEGVSPAIDAAILDNIQDLPTAHGSAGAVLDPFNRLRGSRAEPNPHSRFKSPFFEESAICETCHDVSNPALDRQPDGTYVGNASDTRHPTMQKHDMFPGERTSSEWKASAYAKGGVDAEGRFGGNKRIVSTCQDCHMPDTTAKGAKTGPIRDDLADHGMYGGGTWIPLVVANLYPDEVDPVAIAMGVAGSKSILERAATLELSQSGEVVDVRLINETGHKLPTGQPEGREMWINVRFIDDAGQLIAERGAYDASTGRPSTEDSKMYEIVLGIDQATADATGLPVGPTHHVAFCNVIYKDNRIPPRGYLNAEFERIGAPVVGAYFQDGQYWDDTRFALPKNTVRVEVAAYYKTASTDFIEFLRDANFTNDSGQVLYDQWEITGRSPPVKMVSGAIDLVPFDVGDFNEDGVVDVADAPGFVACLDGLGSGPCDPGDLDGDNDVDLVDAGRFQRRFGSSE